MQGAVYLFYKITLKIFVYLQKLPNLCFVSNCSERYSHSYCMYHVKCALASVIVSNALIIWSEKEEQLSQKRGARRICAQLKNK